MSVKRFNVTMPDQLFFKMEKLRGDVPRSVFLRRLVREALQN
jgi:metal-responsive CopG/Arc/MetJ family transcriptional regulator